MKVGEKAESRTLRELESEMHEEYQLANDTLRMREKLDTKIKMINDKLNLADTIVDVDNKLKSQLQNLEKQIE